MFPAMFSPLTEEDREAIGAWPTYDRKKGWNEGIALAAGCSRGIRARAQAGDFHDRDRSRLAGFPHFRPSRPSGVVGNFADNRGWRLRLDSRSLRLREIDAALYRRRFCQPDRGRRQDEG